MVVLGIVPSSFLLALDIAFPRDLIPERVSRVLVACCAIPVALVPASITHGNVAAVALPVTVPIVGSPGVLVNACLLLIVFSVQPTGFFLAHKVALPGNLVPDGRILSFAGLGIPVALIPTLVGVFLTSVI